MKKCSKCKTTKSKSEFDKCSTTKSGCQSRCKECKFEDRQLTKERDLQRSKDWYAANREQEMLKLRERRKEQPELFQERDKNKYEKHKDKVKARVSQYQKDFPEVNREASKRYRDANPHLQRAKTAKRRARLAQATPSWFDSEFEQFYLAEIFLLAQQRTDLTATEWHVDHIVPLTSDVVCGLHCSDNLRVITAFENISKSNRYWPDMPNQNEVLVFN